MNKKSNLWNSASRLTEKPVRSEKQFSGKLLHLFTDEVTLPDGNRSTREWIQHPGACAVVPVFEDGSVMLIRQYRYPVGQIFYEVPAGKIDPGEPPEITAYRETEEETGLRAHSLEYVGHFYPVIGYSDEIIHIYTAWDLEQLPENSDDDEFLISDRMPFRDTLRMIETGDITDAKTICSLYKTKKWWEKNGPFNVNF